MVVRRLCLQASQRVWYLFGVWVFFNFFLGNMSFIGCILFFHVENAKTASCYHCDWHAHSYNYLRYFVYFLVGYLHDNYSSRTSDVRDVWLCWWNLIWIAKITDKTNALQYWVELVAGKSNQRLCSREVVSVENISWSDYSSRKICSLIRWDSKICHASIVISELNLTNKVILRDCETTARCSRAYDRERDGCILTL